MPADTELRKYGDFAYELVRQHVHTDAHVGGELDVTL
jgi:hypothetical protein